MSATAAVVWQARRGACRSFPNLFVLKCGMGRGFCGSSKLKKGWLNTPSVVLLFLIFFSCALLQMLFLVLPCVRYVGSFDLLLHTCYEHTTVEMAVFFLDQVFLELVLMFPKNTSTFLLCA